MQRQPGSLLEDQAPAAHFQPLEQEASRAGEAVAKHQQPGPLSTLPSSEAGANRWLGNASTGGRPLDAQTRATMEKRFGADLGAVRIHSDQQAANLSRQLNANAFTSGNHIWFGRGQLDPQSTKGGKLLAHELTHTLQQTGKKKAGSEGPSTLAQSSTLSASNTGGRGVVQKEGPAEDAPCAKADLGTMTASNASHNPLATQSGGHIDVAITPGSCPCAAYRFVQVVEGGPGKYKGHERAYVDPSQHDTTASGIDSKPYYLSDSEAAETPNAMADSPRMLRSRVRVYGEGDNPTGHFKAWTVGMCLNPGQPDRVIDVVHWGFSFGGQAGELDAQIGPTKLSDPPEVWKTAVSTDFPEYQYSTK